MLTRARDCLRGMRSLRLIAVSLLLILTAGCDPLTVTRTPEPSATPLRLPSGVDAEDATYATVVRVVDGDTIIAEIDGEEYRVRYIGINSPELANNSRSAEDYAEEAAEYNAELVEGQTVVLERDTSDTDQYNRLLRYVWLDDTLVNEELVRQGLADARYYNPDTARQDTLNAAEDAAREQKLGIWSLP